MAAYMYMMYFFKTDVHKLDTYPEAHLGGQCRVCAPSPNLRKPSTIHFKCFPHKSVTEFLSSTPILKMNLPESAPDINGVS